ncbi:MAG: mismatch-specific DNA-glycosylase [Pseudomonadota bacterium]|nr:mismatch-specific DNA-glycosylase [Pseudomonadota bacterium]
MTTVFCGSAASSASASTGAYYAGPGNRFWPTLSETGLTPHQFEPSEFQKLAALGIGLTDLAKYEYGMDKGLSSAAYDTAALIEKIKYFTPSLLAFTAKRPASIFMLSALDYNLKHYGEQAVRIGPTRIFVLPSPSGAARRWWSLKPWLTLANNHRLERDER